MIHKNLPASPSIGCRETISHGIFIFATKYEKQKNNMNSFTNAKALFNHEMNFSVKILRAR